MAKYTLADVDRVAQAIKSAKDRGRAFAFLIGAGVSKAANVPLAGELIKLVEEKHPAEFAKIPEPDRKNYGRVMGRLSLGERRDLLKPIMDEAKINWANVAIAAILKKGFIDRVLTLNFDNVLERACGICGYYPAVYDFGTAPSNSVDHVVSGSIVHLHGQSYGLVMLNTDEETKRHSDAIRPLVQDTLHSHGLLVVGYSGGADSLFPVVAECHSGRERVYWLGHNEEPAEQIRPLLDKPYTEFLGGVDADVFLIELAKQLGCWPPAVLIRPYEHLREEVRDVVDYPKALAGDTDLVKDLRGQLVEWEAYRTPQKETDRLRELLLQGKYQQVIDEGDSNVPAQADIMAWARIEEAHELTRDLRNEERFKNGLQKYTEALAIRPDKHEALNSWGAALSRLAELKQDEALYAQSFEKYAAAVAIQPDDHEALYNWGTALSDLARLKQDAGLFAQGFEKYAAAVAIKPDFPEALNNWGSALSALAELKKDEGLYAQSFEKYAAALAIKPDQHEALNNWGNALCSLWHVTKNDDLLSMALEKHVEAEAISGRPSYNLACCHALVGHEDTARQKLMDCREAGTLPDKAHLTVDPDWEAYREKDWFKDLLDSLT
jgi:tetratricopeptide (TPR) repeat protein/NAD-dependent SIR2 family protein deacetylase